MDTMKYNHKELPLVPFSELKGKTYVILSAHLYLQSIIAGMVRNKSGSRFTPSKTNSIILRMRYL